jgi:hypothetical protein
MKPFCELIQSFNGESAFDAFAGSSLLSRYTKDTRPDLTVYTNDIGNYFQRLSKVKETNKTLDLMRKKGGYRSNDKYMKYDNETERALKDIVESSEDKETLYQNFYSRHGNSPRAKLRTVNYNELLCAHWYDGLVVTRMVINCFIAPDNIQADLLILDPPYTNRPAATKSNQDYIGDTKSARDFCKSAINSKTKYILFDLRNSELATLALDNGARIVCDKSNNYPMFAKDVMITNV